MAEEQVRTPIDELPMDQYKKARASGAAVEEVEPEIEEEHKEEPKPKAKGGFQSRIDRLVKHNSSLETRAEQLERENNELKAKANGNGQRQQVQGDPEPKLEDYQSQAEWIRASIQWGVRQGINEHDYRQQKQKEFEESKAIFDAHNERISEARARIDDFDEVLKTTKSPWSKECDSSRAFQIAMFESDNGPDVAYYLGKNPEEFAKLADLTPNGVQRAIWKLSEKLAKDEPAEEEEEEQEVKEEPKPKAKIESKAPAPIRPVGSGATKSSVPLGEMSMRDFKKARAAGRVS